MKTKYSASDKRTKAALSCLLHAEEVHTKFLRRDNAALSAKLFDAALDRIESVEMIVRLVSEREALKVKFDSEQDEVVRLRGLLAERMLVVETNKVKIRNAKSNEI